MDLVVLSHLEVILCGKWYYLTFLVVDLFTNKPLCHIINQQQMQWVVYVVPRVVSTWWYHRS